MVAAIHRRAAIVAGAEVVGVLASTPVRSREVATQWGVEAFEDLTAVLRSDADVVHVCTPNALHREQAGAVLRDGRHVICEKPLGVTAAEAEALEAMAAEASVVATVPFVYRYHPLVREIRARALAGEFGDWLLAHGSYLQDWLLSPDVSNWRVDARTGGPSRAVADIGTHWFDLVEWVSGLRFEGVSATTAVAIPERSTAGSTTFADAASDSPRSSVQTEDAAMILLRCGGVLGSTAVSQVSAGRKNRLWFELDGTRGSACFDQEEPERIWLGTAQGGTLVPRGTGTSAEERRLSTLPPGHAQGYAQCFEAFVADTYDAIRGRAPEGLPTFADGVRAARFVEAVMRSHTTGAWTEIGR
jgi:predicted dehydrogenase